MVDDAGLRIHGTTQRRPLEVFRTEELAHLLPVPEATYDVPLHRDASAGAEGDREIQP